MRWSENDEGVLKTLPLAVVVAAEGAVEKCLQNNT